jgi:hypothetical protein
MIDLGRVCRNKRHSKNASRSPLFVWCRPVLDVLPASIEFYNSVGKSGARVYQANTATNAFENDTTHFNDAGAGNRVVSSWKACFTPPIPVWFLCKRLLTGRGSGHRLPGDFRLPAQSDPGEKALTRIKTEV